VETVETALHQVFLVHQSHMLAEEVVVQVEVLQEPLALVEQVVVQTARIVLQHQQPLLQI
jgi:hypothetical protein